MIVPRGKGISNFIYLQIYRVKKIPSATKGTVWNKRALLCRFVRIGFFTIFAPSAEKTMLTDTQNTESESGVFLAGEAGGGEVMTGRISGLEEIYRSGNSVVYKACMEGRRVVLKGLPGCRRSDATATAALRKEYSMLLEMDHPGIARVFSIEDVPAVGPAIVMEYIDGYSLADTDLRKLSGRERRRLMREITDAVAYMHSKGIVHRDLKPSNVMVTRLGRHARLIDFGLADSDSWGIGKQPAGTEGYVSAEQRTSRIPDPRNDVYSLGVIMKMLAPGPLYRRVNSRCLGPIGRRYASAERLSASMRRVRRNFIAAICLLAAVLLTGISLLPFIRQEHARNATEPQGVFPPKASDNATRDTPRTERHHIPADAPTLPAPATLSGQRGGEPERTEIQEPEEAAISEELIREAYAVLEEPYVDNVAKLEAATSPKHVPPFMNSARMGSQAEIFEELQAPSLSPKQRELLHEVLRHRINENINRWDSIRKRKLEELSAREPEK